MPWPLLLLTVARLTALAASSRSTATGSLRSELVVRHRQVQAASVRRGRFPEIVAQFAAAAAAVQDGHATADVARGLSGVRIGLGSAAASHLSAEDLRRIAASASGMAKACASEALQLVCFQFLRDVVKHPAVDTSTLGVVLEACTNQVLRKQQATVPKLVLETVGDVVESQASSLEQLTNASRVCAFVAWGLSSPADAAVLLEVLAKLVSKIVNFNRARDALEHAETALATLVSGPAMSRDTLRDTVRFARSLLRTMPGDRWALLVATDTLRHCVVNPVADLAVLSDILETLQLITSTSDAWTTSVFPTRLAKLVRNAAAKLRDVPAIAEAKARALEQVADSCRDIARRPSHMPPAPLVLMKALGLAAECPELSAHAVRQAAATALFLAPHISSHHAADAATAVAAIVRHPAASAEALCDITDCIYGVLRDGRAIREAVDHGVLETLRDIVHRLLLGDLSERWGVEETALAARAFALAAELRTGLGGRAADDDFTCTMVLGRISETPTAMQLYARVLSSTFPAEILATILDFVQGPRVAEWYLAAVQACADIVNDGVAEAGGALWRGVCTPIALVGVSAAEALTLAARQGTPAAVLAWSITPEDLRVVADCVRHRCADALESSADITALAAAAIRGAEALACAAGGPDLAGDVAMQPFCAFAREVAEVVSVIAPEILDTSAPTLAERCSELSGAVAPFL